MSNRGRQVVKCGLHLSSKQISKHWRRATIWYVQYVNACHHLEQLAGQMRNRAGAIRRKAELPGIGLEVGDELGSSADRNRWIYLQDKWGAAEARDRRDIADQIETELVKERGVDRVCCNDQKQRIAIGRGTHDCLGGDIAGGPGAGFNDEWLT